MEKDQEFELIFFTTIAAGLHVKRTRCNGSDTIEILDGDSRIILKESEVRRLASSLYQALELSQ